MDLTADAQKAFEKPDYSLASIARGHINTSNWHFIRESEDPIQLVSVIVDFISNTTSLFSSEEQVATLCDQIEK